ncbi:unnamed protein product [Boreogadus saida]
MSLYGVAQETAGSGMMTAHPPSWRSVVNRRPRPLSVRPPPQLENIPHRPAPADQPSLIDHGQHLHPQPSAHNTFRTSRPEGKTSCCSGEPQNPLLSRREIDSQQSFTVCEEEVYQEPRQTDSCWGPPAYGDLRQATHSPLCWSSAALDVAYTS